jgi:hypothetical protein
VLRDVTEVSEGDTVYLYPQTKQASRACHDQRTAKVLKDPKVHWPMVVVGWDMPGGPSSWELVHKDNIRKRPASTTSAVQEKRDGDMVGGGSGGMSKWVKKGTMTGKPAPEIEGQGTLF